MPKTFPGAVLKALAAVITLLIALVAALLASSTRAGAPARGGAAESFRAKAATIVDGGASASAPKLAPFGPEDFAQAPATRYSSPRREHIAQELEYFATHPPGAARAVDLTAHVGVDTAVLAEALRARAGAEVVAVERDPAVFALLRQNAAPGGPVAGRAPVTLVEASAVDVAADPAAFGLRPPYDLAYLDPPWGGPAYKRRRAISDLPLDGAGGARHPLAPVVDAALANLAPVVVVKAPFNFDVAAFERRLQAGRVVETRRVFSGARAPRPAFVLLEVRRPVPS